MGNNTKIVVIIGLPGVGKSTFINAAAGKEAAPVGNDLDLVTRGLQFVECERNSRQVILVDTPGFGDMPGVDCEIWTELLPYLRVQHDKGIALAGLIYLHDMTMARSALVERSLRNFEPCIIKHLIPATTKWGGSLKAEVGRTREGQLCELWKTSQVPRFVDSFDSAWNIIDIALERDTENTTALWQGLFKPSNVPKQKSSAPPARRSGFWRMFRFK